MKNNNFLANALFWLTLISPMLSFSVACEIGETDIFGIIGTVRYSWIIWLFIPFGIFSLIIGKRQKLKNKKYKKNYIVAFICIPLLLIFGSYRFIFIDISYSADELFAVEEKVNIDLPENIKIATDERTQYSISYVKLTDETEREHFENELETSNLWKPELSTKLKAVLPIEFHIEIINCDYFLLYNQTNAKYNLYPSVDGKYEFVFIAYDRDLGRMIVLHEYTVDLS